MRTRYWALALVLLHPAPAAADWHIKPFVGLTFGGGTTLVDVEEAVGKPNPIVGVTCVLLGNILGVEGDLGLAPGMFESGGKKIVNSSRVTTLTGNVVVAMPKRMTEYTLRPYLVGGIGLMHVQVEGRLGAIPVSSSLPAGDFGGGATGCLDDPGGLRWGLRA